MFYGGLHMIRKFSLTAGLLGSAMLLTGCVTPYVSGSVGTRIGSGGYISGSVGGYPGSYGGYNRYGYGGSYGYGGGSIYGYDQYGRPLYRLPDGRLVVGGGYNNGYDRYYRGYPSYGYPNTLYRSPSYGYPGYGYPGYGYPRSGYPGYRNPGHYRPPAHPYSPPPVTRPGGDSGVPSVPITRSTGGNSSGDILRQAREYRKAQREVDPNKD